MGFRSTILCSHALLKGDTKMPNICSCKLGDFGNDGKCNRCLGGIVCNDCGRIPCECLDGDEWLGLMLNYEALPNEVEF